MIRFHRPLCFSCKKGETFGMYAVTFLIYTVWLCRNLELTCIGLYEQMPVGLGMAAAISANICNFCLIQIFKNNDAM